jgi:hypothetical protein
MKTPTRFSAGIPDPSLTPFERFEQFARKIVSVPKGEADKIRVRSETGKKKKS